MLYSSNRSTNADFSRACTEVRFRYLTCNDNDFPKEQIGSFCLEIEDRAKAYHHFVQNFIKEFPQLNLEAAKNIAFFGYLIRQYENKSEKEPMNDFLYNFILCEKGEMRPSSLQQSVRNLFNAAAGF